MPKPRFPSSQAGFTLVELLVAMAVLAIIVVAAAQMIGAAGMLTTVNNKHIDANDQARMVFDRMADDFARMAKRKDVDYLFWKNSPSTTTGTNDVFYFYTEGASYFDSSTFSLLSGYPTTTMEKNSVSLVGYRVNNNSASPDYNQVERLGKALSWDGGAYSATTSAQPNVAAFLTYPAAGTDVAAIDPSGISYSAAFFASTIWGSSANSGTPGGLPSAVGTKGLSFNNSTDTSYRAVGSQVFRLEYSFQLKDGTMSDKPMMVYSTSNGIPSSTITATTHPIYTNDSTTKLANPGTVYTTIGSRWWDKSNQIGYICVDATPNYAVWHEIGIQDVAAIIVTIAVIDKQGLTFLKAKGGDLKNIAATLPDYSLTATPTTSSVAGDPAYLLDPNKSTAPVSWAYALLPGNGVSAVTGNSKLPQEMISQIRLYQRYFYLNSF